MKLKDRIKHSKALYRQPETKLTPQDLSTMMYVPRGMTRAWANNRFIVMIFDDAPTSHGLAIRVMVQAANGLPIPSHWKTMQGIKNAVFGPETTAVEYYPAQSELMDTLSLFYKLFPFSGDHAEDGIAPSRDGSFWILNGLYVYADHFKKR